MEAQIINGRQLAQAIEAKLQEQVLSLGAQNRNVPGLATIVVGNDPSSHKFVRLKGAAAKRVGINFEQKSYPDNFDPGLIIKYIQKKNADPRTHGIIVQLPLPENFNRSQILKAVHPFKDVDCLHPKNLGLLMLQNPLFIPPAVQAILHVIAASSNYSTSQSPHFTSLKQLTFLRGKRVAVIGSGLLIGKPLSVVLLNLGATVSVANEFTQNLAQLTQAAEIIISATGVEKLITAEHIPHNAIVIDASRDVDTNSVKEKAAVLCPSPGGIGPLTIAYLLLNTWQIFKQTTVKN